ncbi:hypothetical protein [Arcobacter sp. YIC-310]|uniref:hypothetical protein n=1 Tax=Arcobacter sp. YIC-310 TaxID=3376632 RepID=UPI003C1D431F
MKIKFTLITNNEGSLNKTFSLDQYGQIKKESNAFLVKGTAQTFEVNSLSEFYHVLENLHSNQAIILGVINEQQDL